MTVSITQTDLKIAVQDGIITTTQARELWRRWSSNAASPASAAAPPSAGFSFTNTLYYFGGMVAIGAMSLFMTLGWSAFGSWGLLLISAAYLFGCLKVADYLKKQHFTVPAGILATLAIVLVPLIVWCAQHAMGMWADTSDGSFSAYHTHINWRWITLEFATLMAGVVMLWRYRLPFMVMPIAVTIWYMSMDFANFLIEDTKHWDWQLMRDMSLVFGLITVGIAIVVDLRSRRATDPEWRQDYAFWLYFFGAIMAWSSLSFRNSGSEWGKVVYCLINVGLVFFGAAIGRRVFTILGAFGVTGYLGYLSHQVFRDSLLFPFALTLLGLGVVALGIWWQRNEAEYLRRLNFLQTLRMPIA
jgi:hypothetical protein